MSLRAELIGATAGMPGFAVLLPPDWQATDGAGDGLRERTDAVLAGFPAATRVALRSQLDALMATASASARADVIRVFAPSGAAPEDFLPVTLVASWLRAPSGGSIQQIGAGLIADRGATVLGDSSAILRWTMDQTVELEGAPVRLAGAGYLLPVPGSHSTGLLFRSQILRSAAGTDVDDDGIRAMALLCDAIVASLRWRREVAS
ncbi:hypothetical protein N3K63_05365 [Microbacterium sp. W1N]|uniref:hypothetical protein n=1 Tax=Microbacterium festucae TaxID=2977531 RepID=UPI0021C219D9|nr:hypothetical protein [Microbacterium festucae]MCT9819714.1 hypothetical protein [Microbacterium festucae]